MIFQGQETLNYLELPPFELPNGFEKYDPKVDEQINRAGKISGTKKAEYLLIPRIAGTREIPPIEFSYFDPEKRSYQTISSKSFSVSIEQGQGGASDYANQQSIEQLDSDIRFIKTKFGDVNKQSEILLFKPAFWIASLAPIFSFFSFDWMETQTG
ncbi:MAG: BatD family protein [Ignavibacteriales bacterium]|nr:BatD family protein [Ignavibacteriales bacterium]